MLMLRGVAVLSKPKDIRQVSEGCTSNGGWFTDKGGGMLCSAPLENEERYGLLCGTLPAKDVGSE